MSIRKINVAITKEEAAHIPSYGSEEAAGADVRAHISEDIVLEPGERTLVPTGVKIALPTGYEVQVRPRSGLAFKHGISVVNTPGTIDSDYRGEVKIILINHGKEPFIITPGMRIAQLVVAEVIHMEFVEVSCLSETLRGAGGFGHTGTH